MGFSLSLQRELSGRTQRRRPLSRPKAMVTNPWSSEEYAALNKSSAAVLKTDEVEQISAWAAFRTPNGGHVFY
jgi:hypothetical protein